MKYFCSLVFSVCLLVASVLLSSAVSNAVIAHLLYKIVKLNWIKFFVIKNLFCQKFYAYISDGLSFVGNKN